MNKKILSIAMLLAGSFFVSCEDDDEFTKYEPVNYLEGKWELVQNGALNSLGVINYTDVEVAENCFKDNFISDAQTGFTATDFTSEGEACNQEESMGTYEIVDGNLILNSGDLETSYDILTFSNTTLDLVFTDEETGELVFRRFRKTE